MSLILNYSRWRMLAEQQSTATSAGPIDFVLAAGTDPVFMSDAVLNKEQGYPLAKGAGDKTKHMYTIKLSTALTYDFSKAVPGEKVTADIIEFDGAKIVDSGKIAIEWNKENFNKPIMVSGNGALALARAAKEIAVLQNRGTLAGVIILELKASARYSKLWSIGNFNISKDDIAKKQNTLSKGLALSLVNSTDLPKVQALSAGGKGTPFAGNFDNNGAIWLTYKPSPKENSVATYPPQKSENNPIFAQDYEKYSIDQLATKTASGNIAPKTTLKNLAQKLVVLIDKSLDNLAAYLPNFLKESLTGVDEQYTSRLAKRMQETVLASKSTAPGSMNNAQRHANQIATHLLVKESDVRTASSGSVSQAGTSYASGEA